MFAIVVLILQFYRCRSNLWIDHLTICRHFCNFFQNDCIVYCLMCILAPGKWSVVLAKNRRRCDIVDALSLKLISDQDSCVEFVSLIDP